MENLGNKISGNSLTASEWNQAANEVLNIIQSAGLGFSVFDLDQLGKGVAHYAAGADFATDVGVANAYSVTALGSRQAPPVLTDGMCVKFRAANTNTSVCTLDAYGLGAKPIRTRDGNELSAKMINSGRIITLRFDAANDWWEYAVPNRILDSVVGIGTYKPGTSIAGVWAVDLDNESILHLKSAIASRIIAEGPSAGLYLVDTNAAANSKMFNIRHDTYVNFAALNDNHSFKFDNILTLSTVNGHIGMGKAPDSSIKLALSDTIEHVTDFDTTATSIYSTWSVSSSLVGYVGYGTSLFTPGGFGLRSNGTNVVIAVNGATTIMTFDTSNRVGIGTDITPGQDLAGSTYDLPSTDRIFHVRGSSSVPAHILVEGDSAAMHWIDINSLVDNKWVKAVMEAEHLIFKRVTDAGADSDVLLDLGDTAANMTPRALLGIYGDDRVSSGTALVIHGVIGSSFVSVGPTGSGATVIWPALDNRPTNARFAKVKIVMSMTGTAATQRGQQVFAQKSAAGAGVDGSTLIAYIAGINTSTDGNVTCASIPIDNNGKFDFAYVIGDHFSANCDAYFVGWE